MTRNVGDRGGRAVSPAWLCLGLFALPAPALSQDTDTAVEQVPASAVRLDGDGVVRSVRARKVGTMQEGRGERPAVAQLGSRTQSRGRNEQLTTERRGGRAPEQLNRGGPTAQPSEPLSRPRDGRTGAVTRVVGNDLCNRPQADPALARACARAIETRAAEFAGPDPAALSPEQRLLAEQRVPTSPTSFRNAARRLAGEGDTDTMAGQGVASLVLGTDRDVSRPFGAPGPALSAEAQALIEVIVGTIAPPRP